MSAAPISAIRRLPTFAGALLSIAIAGIAPKLSAPAAAATAAPAALETLVGRVALYPDDLLALVLPASTQPLQVVEAKRLLEQKKSNPKVKPPTTWDPSVVALLNYPEVIKLMNDDLTWTQQLGTSVISQQAQL